jgi:hypothetical protein
LFSDHRKITYLNVAGAERPLRSPVPQRTIEDVRLYRLGRIREQLILNGCGAILLYDPVNIRYATDVSNMQVWTLHNASRYVLIFAEGPCILFEYKGAEHLAKGFATVDEVRVATTWFYFGTGSRTEEWAARWADEIADLVRSYCGSDARLAIDKCEPLGVELLKQRAIVLVDGQKLTEHARCIKSPGEVEMMSWTVRVCEAAMHRVHQKSIPGLIHGSNPSPILSSPRRKPYPDKQDPTCEGDDTTCHIVPGTDFITGIAFPLTLQSHCFSSRARILPKLHCERAVTPWLKLAVRCSKLNPVISKVSPGGTPRLAFTSVILALTGFACLTLIMILYVRQFRKVAQ